LLLRYYGIPDNKIRTIYNGVDTAVFRPDVRQHSERIRASLSLQPDAPLLLFASMDFEGKGLRAILAALKVMRERQAHLLVLGAGPIQRFKRIACRFCVGNRVVFAGRVSNIQEYYGAADLALLPTVYEPFPNVNLEAMACGLPVLTTMTAGGADLVEAGKTGYLISDAHSTEEMIDQLNAHFSLRGVEQEEMRQRCWNRAKTMTVEQNARQTVKLFEEALEEKYQSRAA